MKKMIITGLSALLLFSCASAPEEEIIEFAFELEELEALPEKKKVVVVVVEEEVEYEYIVTSVAEVEEVDGVQKYFYIKLGYSREGLVRDLHGKIYNDVERKEQIGTFKLIEVFMSFSKAKILELNFKLNSEATIVFEIEKGE